MTPGRGRHGSRAPDHRSAPPVRKSLGQHFLTDRRILDRIVDALDAQGETVIEIGPGRGALTDALAARASTRRLVAVEYDRALAEQLRRRYTADPRIEVVQADVLQADFGALAAGAYVLVGNIPYYITTPILFQALRPPRPVRAVLLVQLEVAQRMTAAPGSKQYGALSVNVQALAAAETVFRVPAGAFRPPPKVESAVVRITPREQPLVGAAEEQPFREFVQATFGLRRKQLRRALRAVTSRAAADVEALLLELGLSPEVRAEELSPDRFVALFRRLRLSRGS